jgi:hypothetical protein
MNISEEIKQKIVKEFIEPSYTSDIKHTIEGKKCWKITSQIFETISKILVALGSVLSFSSGYFDNPHLSFIAGAISALSLFTLQFSTFSYKEHKKKNNELKKLPHTRNYKKKK